MKRVWLAWLVFGLCAGAMLAVTAWITGRLAALEANERKARQEAALEENVRLSLWRMETALAAVIVQENSRPYRGYVAPERAGEGSPYVALRFEIDPERRLTLPPAVVRPPRAIEDLRQPAALNALRAAIPHTWIRVEQREAAAPVQVQARMEPPPAQADSGGSQQAAQMVQQAAPMPQGLDSKLQKSYSKLSPKESQVARNFREYEARGMLNANQALLPGKGGPRDTAASAGPAEEVRTGVLAPLWVGDDLILARAVRVGSRELVQGCRVDWRKVRFDLLNSIRDLLPGSELAPERGRFDPAEGRTLASLPLRLLPGRAPGTDAEEASSMRWPLRIAWIGMALAIVSVGLLLFGEMSLSQRRAAFVSSVTHELRSPLTTFRMYTEMLVEGMAADPAKQSQYHQVLYRESERLVHLVENVLAYARLERGRYGDKEAVAVGELLGRVRDRLAEHARLAGMELVVSMDAAAEALTVSADASAIERILFNLVDNACKYARSAGDRRIHLDVEQAGRWVRVTVRDHGPGIDRRRVRRLFRPFQKSASEAAKTAPGVGIGLSLSRRLAQAAGGRLQVLDSAEGASVRLELPQEPGRG